MPLAEDVKVPLPTAPTEEGVINWITAHPDVAAAVVTAFLLFLLWRSKFRVILIIIGTILLTVIVMKGALG